MENSKPVEIDVVLLPITVTPESLAGKTVIVVDVLRATTTIITALSNGCSRVLPQPSVDAAREAFKTFDGPALIGGERGGKIVDGFHNGNSPIEYTPDVIQDKTLILATTNGTVAMEHCRQAERVLIGAMINVGAVAEAVEDSTQVTVLCSGTDRIITSEDVLFAGALVDCLIENRNRNGKEVGLVKDTAKLARDHWRATRDSINDELPLADYFRKARGGVNLVRIGHDADIVFASQLDTSTVVPELDLEAWSIGLS